ncbi:CocE/NonD family hydrolase [Streptomyces sp. NPDC006706]|uniref:CocE/NonD family hydrolase n=1 Tax=Streptomyces sp. NPDC006706 TaxID=3364761 RepID=UPI0036CBCA08
MAPFLRATLRLQRRLRDVTFAQPLRGAYVSALGGEVPWLDDVMTHPDADDAYWRGASPAAAADRLNVPTSLITGWHDALVDQTLEQYGRLRRSGCRTALLVGPWTHTSALQQGWPEMFADSLAWLRAHLCGDPSGLRPTAVRVHIGGEDAWRDLDDWPADPATTTWFPTPDGHLTRQAPTDSGPLASFRYDPADPTPSLGGPLLSRGAGPRANSGLEARDDVLTFTGPPLTEPVDVLGPVSTRLGISTDTGHADVFTRLCDVDPQGRSVNVCDWAGPDEDGRADARAGHRAHERHRPPLRRRSPHTWQISAGAHPRYARNPGTGESPVDATTFTAVRVTLHADSALTLAHGSGPA